MKIREVLACSFPEWYANFSKVTFRSRILPIPEEVLEYFRSDSGVILPKECDSEQREAKAEDYEGESDEDWSAASSTSSSSSSSSSSDETEQRPEFPEFSETVDEAIEALGGRVFPKLNWSCPKDAAWIGVGNSLKCLSKSQVYLLLKSSDFIAHDLTQPFKDCDDFGDESSELPKVNYSLVLRRWVNINPGNEFRCFVKDKELIAISQRDDTQFYDHISQEEESIKRDIRSFFVEHIKDKFPLRDFVVDVVRFGKDDKVRLVDFNPFGPTTDGLLFKWSELKNWVSNELVFRYIDKNNGIQPNSIRRYSIPRDMVDLMSGTDPDKLIDFLKLVESKNKQE